MPEDLLAQIDVTVVIPTFRRPELLREAITGALTQEGVNVEVVVVDDSPEGSARSAVASFADPRVHYIKNERPSGGNPALVRNAGWPKSRGRFIHFLDDDDRPVQGFYRAAVQAFEQNPDRGVVFGRVEPFGADPNALVHEREFFADATRRARIAARMRSRRWMTAVLLFQPTVLVNSACMIRRECVASVEGYNPDIPMNEDIDLYQRAVRKFGCVFLDRVVIEYRILGDSLMHGRGDDNKLAEAYRKMYAGYRRTNGVGEWLALKVFSKTLLQFI